MRSTRRIAAYTSALVAMVALVGCGGDDSGDPGETASSQSTSQTSDDTTDASGAPDQASDECVGDGKGSITLTSDESVDLPGGSKAALAAADMAKDPPTVSLDLGQATKLEQKNATGLKVGDRFGVARSVYIVVRICTDETAIDEF